MEPADSNSDSETEFDQNELEVALYSQIHFDSSKDDAASFDTKRPHKRVSQLFKIGVKELPTKSAVDLKKPNFGGDFLAFSSDDCGDVVEANSPKSHGATSQQKKDVTTTGKQSKIEPSKDKSKITDSSSFGDKTTKRNNRLMSDTLKKHEKLSNNSSGSKLTASNTDKLELQTAVLGNEQDTRESSTEFICPDLFNIHEVENEIVALAKELNNTSKANKKNKVEDEIIALTEELNKTPKANKKNEVNNEIIALAGELNKTPNANKKNKAKAVAQILKENETLLPFSVTKTPKMSIVAQTENVTPDKPIEQTSSDPVKKKKVPNPSKANLPKLESFLELSAVPKKKKKASLTKTDAAVKPRKPAVFLRRPPTVVVKYRQDSDTNTDYSDSDVDITMASPLKMKLNTLKDSSKQMSPQHASVADKAVKAVKNVTKAVIGGKSASKESAARHEKSTDKVKVEQEPVIVVNISSGAEDEESEECKDIEDNSRQEGSTSDNEDSENSDADCLMMETIPGLEFNLDKGVAGRAISESDADNWKIADRDRHNIVGTLTRYFAPRTFQCRNCKADGHMSRDCPQPLKRRCIFCGANGHSYQGCPSAICFNCNAPGHRVSDCKEGKRSWNVECGRCWMPGHDDEHCPDRWRQYHITINSDVSLPETADKDAQNSLVFCYNCGGKGHLGFECKLPRMNQFIIATYPFIARYDSKNKCKGRKQDEKDVNWSRKAGHGPGDHSRQLKEKNIKQRHGQNKNLRAEDSNSSYYRKHSSHNEEETQYYEEGKRKRQTNQQRKMNKKARLESGGHGNTSTAVVSREHLSDYPRQKRKFAQEDVVDDFNNHQVNNNEWWARNELPGKKKRKGNAQDFSPNVTDNDWQNRKRGQPYFDGSTSFQRRQAQKMDSSTPQYKGEWLNNRPQKQRVPENNFSTVSSTQHKWTRQSNNPSSRDSETRLYGGRQNNMDTNHGHSSLSHAKSRSDNNFKPTQLQHSDSWPSYKKNTSNLPPNRNGFQARNNRFVAMKTNCDITINIRK